MRRFTPVTKGAKGGEGGLRSPIMFFAPLEKWVGNSLKLLDML